LSELKRKHDQYLSLIADAESDLEGKEDYFDVVAAQVEQVAAEVRTHTSLEVRHQDSVSQVSLKHLRFFPRAGVSVKNCC